MLNINVNININIKYIGIYISYIVVYNKPFPCLKIFLKKSKKLLTSIDTRGILQTQGQQQ